MASDPASRSFDMREQVLHECSAMARYALASGMAVPPQLMATIENVRDTTGGQASDIAALTRAHTQLAKLVAPATPRALLLMGDEHDGPRLAWLGHVGLARRMMGAALIAMLAFLGISLVPLVDFSNKTLQNTSGLDALVLEVWWLSAAAMGASFALLMQVSDYIVRRTYDPKYEPTYWIKLLLGIMAGLILVGLLPIPQTGGAGGELTRPAVALLGGFSGSAVYRILIRLVEAVESFFRPSPGDQAAERERVAMSRANDDVNQARIALAGQIVRLQQQVASGAGQADLSSSLQRILRGLVPSEPAPPAETPAADAPPAGTISFPNVPIVGDAGRSDDGSSVSRVDASGSAAEPNAEADDVSAPVAAASDEPAAG